MNVGRLEKTVNFYRRYVLEGGLFFVIGFKKRECCREIISLSLHYLQVFAPVFAIGGKSVDTELESNNFNYSDIFSLETRLSKYEMSLTT